MPHTRGFLKRLWHSVKDQIVQTVPQEMQFCEFQCPYEQCRLELTGNCEILPVQTLVLIQQAQAAAHPQCAVTASVDPLTSPLQVN